MKEVFGKCLSCKFAELKQSVHNLQLPYIDLNNMGLFCCYNPPLKSDGLGNGIYPEIYIYDKCSKYEEMENDFNFFKTNNKIKFSHSFFDLYNERASSLNVLDKNNNIIDKYCFRDEEGFVIEENKNQFLENIRYFIYKFYLEPLK